MIFYGRIKKFNSLLIQKAVRIPVSFMFNTLLTPYKVYDNAKDAIKAIKANNATPLSVVKIAKNVNDQF